MKNRKQLQVNAIKDGTVIDHIPAKNLFKVISILGLDKIETPITFGTNLESKRLGSKAIIKISNITFDKDEINKIALVAPEAKLNKIHDYDVIEKKVVEVPDMITGIVKCVNPKFYVLSKKEVNLKCFYCEKITSQENINII
jgi:aspartate carbamoyltransferase regulatory subunit